MFSFQNVTFGIIFSFVGLFFAGEVSAKINSSSVFSFSSENVNLKNFQIKMDITHEWQQLFLCG